MLVFSDKYVCEMENDVVKSLNPISYIHYVDNTYAKKVRWNQQVLWCFEFILSKCKVNYRKNPTKSLDTEITRDRTVR